MEERVGVDLDEVLDVASVGWWSWEPARDRVRLSTRALSLFGLREDPQDGLPLMLQRVHAEERVQVEGTMRDAARRGAPFELEFRVLGADGERWARARAGPSKLHAGTYAGIVEDVHGRRAAEKEVRRLAAIVASSGDAIIAKDLDGTVRSWNPAAQRIFGYTQEEAVGANIRMLIPEDRWDEEARLMDLIRAGQRIDHYESVRVCKDGKPIQVSLTLSPVFDEAGRISGVSTIARDITHVARQRARLARSEELLHQAQHLARMGSWEWRPPEPRVHWSRELYSVYGLEPEAFVPTFDACIALIHPDDQSRVRRHIEQAAASQGATIDLHYRIRRPDGQVRWLHGRGQVERAEGRTVVRGTCQDVTETHRAQVQFKALFEGSPDGMVLLDAAGSILLTNPQLNRQFGYSSSELVAQPLALLVPALAERDVAHLLDIASPGNLGESLDLHGVRKDGSRFPVELNLRDLELEDGRGFVVTVRDVSERLRLERLKQEAQRLREMADFRAQFINSAAHELKTPLTPVRIQIAILREATRPLGMRAQKAIGVLERNFDRLERIVQDVIEAAKLQAHALHVRLAPVDLSHAVCRAADAFRPLAQSGGLRLECKADERVVAHV
ncbi:MAG TPA: PAS domain S-box protein, partial [Candidatus Thermoplasmatota archaeon]|nr:PAS domain S-box protein [Candidatus Thermoplasmatota archaeon]